MVGSDHPSIHVLRLCVVNLFIQPSQSACQPASVSQLYRTLECESVSRATDGYLGEAREAGRHGATTIDLTDRRSQE